VLYFYQAVRTVRNSIDIYSVDRHCKAYVCIMMLINISPFFFNVSKRYLHTINSVSSVISLSRKWIHKRYFTIVRTNQ
jgi:hypothetical protein